MTADAIAWSVFPFTLVVLNVAAWIRDGWMPVRAPDYPLDFAALTIAGIPIEELGLYPEPRE